MVTERAHTGRQAAGQRQGQPAQAGKAAGVKPHTGGGQGKQATLDRALIDWWRSLAPRTQRGYIGGLLALVASVGLVGMVTSATAGTQSHTTPLALIGAFCWLLYGWGAYPLLALLAITGVVWVIEATVGRALTRRWIAAQALLLWLTLEAASRLYLGGATGGLAGAALVAPFTHIPLWLARSLLTLLIAWLVFAVIGITWAQVGMGLQMAVRFAHLGARHSGRVAGLTVYHTRRHAGPRLTRWRDALIDRLMRHDATIVHTPASLVGAQSLTRAPLAQGNPPTRRTKQALRAPQAAYDIPDLYGDMADLSPYVATLAPLAVTDSAAGIVAHGSDQTLPAQPAQAANIVNANGSVKKSAAVPLTPNERDESEAAPFTPALAISWRLPTPDLLGPLPSADGRDGALDMQELTARLQQTLRSFRVEAEVRPEDASVGPTVIRFGIRPTERPKRDAQGRIVRDEEGRPIIVRTRVSRILSLQDDLALALAVPSLRMEAPVPGQPYIGLEMPRPDAAPVTLRALLESVSDDQQADQQARAHLGLSLPLGCDVTGARRAIDLAACPHLLVAGATGAGKSVCLNACIAALLMRFTPRELRLLLIDPKMVELTAYDGTPHLLRPVITQPSEAVGALRDALAEMERRYRRFARLGVRNFDGYEQRVRQQQQANAAVPGDMPSTETPLEQLPRIVIVIDELADLLATSGEVEGQLVRLAQLARGVGIHLIVATQRPSADILIGALKANIPARIAFLVSSAVDSRVILDCGGAEKLLGRGDMLFLAPDAAKPERIQGAYVSDEAVIRLARFWRKQAMLSPTTSHPAKLASGNAGNGGNATPMRYANATVKPYQASSAGQAPSTSPTLRPLPPLLHRQAPTA
ncbi:MAG: DNA translocase FtsK [Ktedonobacterales bacterium]